MLEYATLCFFKLINTFYAVFDVFRNTQTEPIMILLSFIHQIIKLFDLQIK